MKRIAIFLLFGALLFGVSVKASPQWQTFTGELLKKTFTAEPQPASVQQHVVQVYHGMHAEVFVIERTDPEVLRIYAEDETASDVTDIVLPVAHAPPRSLMQTHY